MTTTPALPTYRALCAAIAAAGPLLDPAASGAVARGLLLLRQTHRKVRIVLVCTVVIALAFAALAFQGDYPYALVCAVGFGIWLNQLNTYRHAEGATRVQLERKIHYTCKLLEESQRLAVLTALYPKTPAAALPLEPPPRRDGYLHRLANVSD
jgi:hypothetical protein